MTRGGPRQGAGRPSRWNMPTTTMRVPAPMVKAIERFIELNAPVYAGDGLSRRDRADADRNEEGSTDGR